MKLTDKLANLCEEAQLAALAIPENAGIIKLLERDKLIARSQAFLEAAKLARDMGV